jgi:hypothetical protein
VRNALRAKAGDKEAATFIAGGAFKATQDNKAGKAVVNMRFDAWLLSLPSRSVARLPVCLAKRAA